MSNFLQFFLRFGGHFMFFLLEGICFFIIIRYNDYQNRIFFSSSNTIIGYVSEKVDGVTSYFTLKRDIKALQKENAALKSKLDNIYYPEEADRDTVFLESDKPRYAFITANIISRAILGNNNNIVIDRGKKDGVEMHMGVVSKNGVVGVVTGVSENYARVMTILHRQAAISAAITRNGYFGSLVWKSSDAREMSLQSIPKHVDIQIGDTIQTSGYSDKFPPSLKLGTVKSFTSGQGSNDYTIDVELFEDLLSLNYVYVVENLYREELKILNAEGNE
jgi:rod shape-determining protein MreC